MSFDLIDAKADSAGAGKAAAFHPDLAAIRAMSAVLPGALPLAVNGVRVAASIRPRKFVIEGGDDTPITMPRTAFQVVYPDCSVMIDSGLDKATHDSFSPDKPEPYFAEQFAKLQRALGKARLIVLTHHHADHVAGVVCAPNFSELAAKTIITMDVADCMMNTPHRPHLKLAPQTLKAIHHPRLSAILSGCARHRVDPVAGPQPRFADGLSPPAIRPGDSAQRRQPPGSWTTSAR